MTSNAEHLVAELLAIQQKHKAFFSDLDQDIFSCVYVHWHDEVRLHIITDVLPEEIENEIRTISFVPEI